LGNLANDKYILLLYSSSKNTAFVTGFWIGLIGAEVGIDPLVSYAFCAITGSFGAFTLLIFMNMDSISF